MLLCFLIIIYFVFTQTYILPIKQVILQSKTKTYHTYEP